MDIGFTKKVVRSIHTNVRGGELGVLIITRKYDDETMVRIEIETSDYWNELIEIGWKPPPIPEISPEKIHFKKGRHPSDSELKDEN